MRTITIGGVPLEVKDYYCAKSSGAGEEDNGKYFLKDEPKLWLYVNVTDSCNAACPFCVNSLMGQEQRQNTIDLGKFENVLQKIAPFVGGLSFTGGEPMLEADMLREAIRIADHALSDDVELDMVTNGTELHRLPEFHDLNRLTTMHISRHAVNDEDNRKLMCWPSAPGSSELKEVIAMIDSPGEIVLNCVMQRGGINDLDGVADYLDFAIDMGVDNNCFAEYISDGGDGGSENGIMNVSEMNKLGSCFGQETIAEWNASHGSSEFRIWNQHHDYDFCRCINGDYRNKHGITRFYYRAPSGLKKPAYCRQLVYTADNKLLAGFGMEEHLIF